MVCDTERLAGRAVDGNTLYPLLRRLEKHDIEDGNPAFLAQGDLAPLFASNGVVTIVLVIVLPIMAIAATVDGFKAIRQCRSPA